MMKKLVKRIPPLALAFSLMCSVVVFAEKQSGSVVDYDQTIRYSLDCEFSLFGKDEAIAVTSWNGKEGYKVRALLYWCENAFSEYKCLGISTSKTRAEVEGGESGVWKFKSKHSVYNTSTKGKKLLSTFTDW